MFSIGLHYPTSHTGSIPFSIPSIPVRAAYGAQFLVEGIPQFLGMHFQIALTSDMQKVLVEFRSVSSEGS